MNQTPAELVSVGPGVVARRGPRLVSGIGVTTVSAFCAEVLKGLDLPVCFCSRVLSSDSWGSRNRFPAFDHLPLGAALWGPHGRTINIASPSAHFRLCGGPVRPKRLPWAFFHGWPNCLKKELTWVGRFRDKRVTKYFISELALHRGRLFFFLNQEIP